MVGLVREALADYLPKKWKKVKEGWVNMGVRLGVRLSEQVIAEAKSFNERRKGYGR